MLTLIAIRLIEFVALLVIGDVLLSWVSPDPRSMPRRITYSVAEPLCAPVRAVLQPRMTMGLDFSPVVVLIGLNLVAGLLASVSA